MSAKRYSIGTLLTTTSLLYTCETSAEVVASLFVVNLTGTARKFTLQHVPADEETQGVHPSVGGRFSIYYNKEVAVGGGFQLTAPIFMSPGDRLYAKAEVASAIVLTAFVVPYSHWTGRSF